MAHESVVETPETIKIIIYACITTMIAEFALWLLIYRKDEYKKLKGDIDSLSNKITKQKDTFVATTQAKTHEKKLNTNEQKLKMLNQEMTSFRMKSTFVIGIFMIIMISSLGAEFQGVVVGKLPFDPFFLIRGITHRGLQGDDFTECSYMFMYIIVSYIVRANIQKVFGFEPPRSHFNSFFQPPK